MDYSQFYTFVCVEQLMTEIGKGVGLANQNMYNLSKNEINALAVKSGTITVDFELSSNAETNDKSLGASGLTPLLGAKTISYSSSNEKNQIINKASIVLNIVSIAPPVIEDKTNNTLPVAKTLDPKVEDYIKKLPTDIKSLLSVLSQLETNIKDSSKLSVEEKQIAIDEITSLREKTNAQFSGSASFEKGLQTVQNELVKFIRDHEELFSKLINA